MLLETILTENKWTPYGIDCTTGADFARVHKFMREAVLDRHIYLNKAIGFKINSNVTSRRATELYIARHSRVGESYPEMMLNIQDKIFLKHNCTEFRVTLDQPGLADVTNSSFTDAEGLPVDCLYTTKDICRVLRDVVTVTVETRYDCGYKPIEKNSKYLDSEYMPCYVDYSLQDYVRVLPPDLNGGAEQVVRLRYFNGMTPNIFKDILAKYYATSFSGKLRKEEREWLSNFDR